MTVSPFWTNTAKLLTGSLISQSIVFLTIPVFTRLYRPEDFGIAAVFSSIVFFISPVSSLGYHQSIILPEKGEDAINLICLSSIIVLIVSLLLLVPFGMFGRQVASFFNTPYLARFLWLVPFGIFLKGIYLILLINSSREVKFGVQAWARIIQTVTDRLIILGAGLAGFASAGLIIIGRLIASFFETGTFLISVPRLLAERKFVSIDSIRRLSFQYRNFPLFSTWTLFLLNITSKMPVFVLAYFFAPLVVGLYAISDRVLQTPMALLGQSVRRVYYQKAASEYNKNEDMRVFFESLREKLIAYSMFPFLLLFVMGNDIFLIALGERWGLAGKYASILGLLVFVQFVSTPLASIFNILEKQRQLLNFTIVSFIARTISLAIGGICQSPILAIWFFVTTGIIVYLSMQLWISQIIGIACRKTIYVFTKYCFLSLPFLGVSYLAHIYFSNTLLICCVIAINILSYYALIMCKIGSLSAVKSIFIPYISLLFIKKT